jgi:hypothetical protein
MARMAYATLCSGLERNGNARLRMGKGLRELYRDCHGERGSLSRLAAHTNGPVQEMHEFLDNGESQSHPAMSPIRRSINLMKFIKNEGQFVARNPNPGIRDLKDYDLLRAHVPDADDNLTVRSKLKGIGQQV